MLVKSRQDWAPFDFEVHRMITGERIVVRAIKENTLQEVYDAVKEDLEISNVVKILYRNKKTEEYTTDNAKTLNEFGIVDSTSVLEVYI